MANIILGRTYWDLTRNSEGHREYTMRLLVQVDTQYDSPLDVASTNGLPRIGDNWTFGNALDVYAYCTPEMRVTPFDQRDNEPVLYYIVEQKFTTMPIKRCMDVQPEDPLLEPWKLSGSFASYSEELTKDRNGDWIQTTSFEQIRGSQVEFERARPTITLEHNTVDLQFDLLTRSIHRVNSIPVWGWPARTVKLSNVSWSREFYLSYACNLPYYKRTFEFQFNRDTWDRDVPNQCTKALGYWDGETELWTFVGDPEDPSAYNRYRDKSGEIDQVLLNEDGKPTPKGEDPYEIHIEGYDQIDFYQLRLPTDLTIINAIKYVA